MSLKSESSQQSKSEFGSLFGRPTSSSDFDTLGRPIRRGYKRVHKEARKVVPKKSKDFKTLRGLINLRAYTMDVTHKQLADAIGCSKQLVDNTICKRATRKLQPWMVKAWSPLLALDAETEAKWLAWAEKERHVVPAPWKKKYSTAPTPDPPTQRTE